MDYIFLASLFCLEAFQQIQDLPAPNTNREAPPLAPLRDMIKKTRNYELS